VSLVLKGIVIILICASYNFIYNFMNWRSISKYKKLYKAYLSLDVEKSREKITKDSNAATNNNAVMTINKLEEAKHKIISLLKGAGIKSFTIQVTIPTGCNHVGHQNIDLFNNLMFKGKIGDTDIPPTILACLTNTVGVYKTRWKEAFNPICWIQLILFLPQNILAYCGVPSGSKNINVANVVYWIIMFGIPAVYFYWNLLK
jgi:hypothetical protein